MKTLLFTLMCMILSCASQQEDSTIPEERDDLPITAYVVTHSLGMDTVYADRYQHIYYTASKGCHYFYIKDNQVAVYTYNLKRGEPVRTRNLNPSHVY